MFASSSRRLTITSYPKPAREDDASASDDNRTARSAPSTTPAGSALSRSATAARAASSTAALRCADGCAPAVLALDLRKAVDTVVATESGISMPAGASKCTHPSPSDGCRPRTRATSYAMPATLELPPFRENFAKLLRGSERLLRVRAVRRQVRLREPGHPASHTSRVGLGFGTLIALFLLIAPGAIIGRIAQLTWPIAIAVAAALTYGVVALAIIPLGALGIPWNGWTALAALAVGLRGDGGFAVAACPLSRHRGAKSSAIAGWPAITVAAGVVLGVLLVGWAAWRGTRALAIHSQHLGRGLARQHGALHPRHRPGVVHPHG